MTAVRRAPSHSKENGHIAPIPAPLCANLPHPSAGNTPDDTPVSATSELTHTWVHFAKTFVLIFPIYALGYFEFSFSWLLIGLVVFFWWRRNTGGKYSRLSRALAFFEQEERSVKQSLTTSDLPSWEQEEQELSCKAVMEQLSPTSSDIRLSPSLNTAGYNGNTEIDVDIKRYYCKAGIKSIQIHGVLRVVMEPLLGDMPLVGALSLFFLKKPLLDINWTGLTNILDIPGLNGFSDSLIQDIIYSYLVLPNRITVPLVGDVELAQLRFPMPKGVLRIHFLEAQDLEGKDKFLGGLIKGKSDPYGILQIGNQLFQSKTIKESLHPKWNEVYEALVYEHSGQHLEIELFDEDPDKDDFLGSLMIDMTELHKEQKVDEWFDLEEAPTGKLHLKLEWLSLLSTPTKLDQVLRSVRADRSLANDGLSSALLVVYLDSAKNLPSAKKSSSEPSPYVQLTVGHKSLESKVKDDKRKCTLGNLTVPLSGLLAEEDMTLTQCFPLKNSGPSSTIKLKMALRILLLEKQGSSDQPSTVRVRKSSVPQPTTTTPSLRQSISESPLPSFTPPPPIDASTLTLQHRDGEPYSASPLRSTSSLSTCISSSQKHLPHKESTPSLASDISLPFATLELQQRLRQLQNGSAPSQYPLGEIQLTVRHSSQRNKLIVVVHACRNLIAFTKDGSDPFIRLYLLPDKSRTGRRKTGTMKRTLNPVYDQTYDLSEDDVLVLLPISEAPLHHHIQALCEAWWKKGLKEREKFGRSAFLISLQKSFILKKPGVEIQRVWGLHDVLLSLDYTSEDNKEIIDLLLQCFHRPIYIRNDDGKRFLVFLFSWNVNFIWVIHGTIKNQLEFFSKTATASISEIYFRAWKKASGDFLETIESSCIQDFMQNAILLHRASPVHAKVRQIVSYFHTRKGCNRVDKMLYNLYKPILWKALSAPNFEVRANATLIFTEAFPIHDPDQNNQNIDEAIQKQLDKAMGLLDDPHPTVRSNAILGVCKILAKCWELLPPTVITDFMKKLMMELAADTSSPDVRCSVFKCLTIVLDNALSHPLLEKLLPTLKYSLHDTSEKVRTAFLDMLIKVKAVRAAKFWDVCNMDHLLARLAIDSQSVSKRIVDLLFKSFLPVNESEREWCYMAVMSSLLEIVVILWRSVEKALKQNEEAQKYTIAKFGNVMSKYFTTFQDERCTVALIQLASFMPPSAVPTFSCGVLSRLRKMDSGVVPTQYSQLLDCMCSWGQAANILELITDWLNEALPKQGDKTKTSRKVRIQETAEAKPDLALAYLEYLFSSTSSREKVLALGPSPLKQLHTVLGNWKSVLYTHLSSASEDPRSPSVEVALKAFMYHGRLGAHLQHN
eukprot:superscaffoldBa00004453_g18902